MPTKLVLFMAFACVAASLAPAQVVTDPFTYPPGTTVPGYSEERGDWMCTGTAVQANLATTFQELVLQQLPLPSQSLADVTVEMDAIYDVANPGLQYVGPLCRHAGTGGTASFFMLKLQDNGAPYGGFDTAWVYYWNGASWQSFGLSGIAISPPTQLARARLTVVEQASSVLVQIAVDSNYDGTWDITGQATTTIGLGSSGKVGICAYKSSLADQLEVFNIPLFQPTPGPVAIPSTGNPINGRSVPGAIFQGVFSTANTNPFPIGGGWFLPVDWDWLFTLSLLDPNLFPGFVGVVDPNGDFSMSFDVPNVPALSGITIFATAVTFSTTLDGVGPDVPITFQ